jgi:hypothetical protein
VERNVVQNGAGAVVAEADSQINVASIAAATVRRGSRSSADSFRISLSLEARQRLGELIDLNGLYDGAMKP